MLESKLLATEPIFFEKNRISRTYKGGKLFHDFFRDNSVDGYEPEEWVASDVQSLNKNSTSFKAGISKIKGQDIYLDDLISNHKEEILGEGTELGFLVKVLDSAVRLSLQVHPDKAFSMEYFNSTYGKAESWVVLETRENACVHLGFNKQMTQADFEKIVDKSVTDKDVMEDVLNKVPVKKGDIFFIPAKAVHAIGYGCLILEVQEPTDFTFRPEAWCGEYKLTDRERFSGFSKDVALSCFDYEVFGEKAVSMFRKSPKLLIETTNYKLESLITYEDTICFSVNRHTVNNGEFTISNAPSIYVVSDGEGDIFFHNYKKRIKKGDYFLVPHCLKDVCNIRSNTTLELIECLPPKKL